MLVSPAQWTAAAPGSETPGEGNFGVPLEWTRVPLPGDDPAGAGRYPRAVSSPPALGPGASRSLATGLVDVVIAVGSLAVTLALMAHDGLGPLGPGSGDVDRNLDLLGVLLAAASTLPLVASRRRPFGVFVATAAAGVVTAGFGYPLAVALGPAVALYRLAADRRRPMSWSRHRLLAVLGLFGAYLVASGTAQGSLPASELLHSGLAWAIAWFAGERARLRAAHIVDLHERAARAVREADRDRQLAAANERARIARDLHDSAGHAISVIAVRAGAARLRHHENPERSLAALEAIEELARQTVAEIDHLVGNLRESEARVTGIEAPAGLASLDTLLARHGAAGLKVSVDTSGTCPALGDAVDQAAYRILQEALTNAARHGSGRAHLELDYGDEAVELTVTNPSTNGAAPGRAGGGHGLVGMHERAALLGGSLDAGRVDGVFRVRARIPYGGRCRWPES